MKLTLSSVSICRTPIFSVSTKLEDVWQELKDYIQESSPSFYEVIKDYEYNSLAFSDPKTRFTIWKYFNRAKFRATPYGNFAAFALVPVSPGKDQDSIILSKDTIVHRFANWQEKENINYDAKWLTYNAAFLRTNTTVYVCDDELRYINIDNGAFELSSITYQKPIKAILDFCHTKRTLPELHSFLKQYGLTKAMTSYFVEQLISFQLLLTDFQPNIIGTDYFNRISYPHPAKKNDYIIAERKQLKGQLSEKNLDILIELTTFLNSHITVNNNPALEDFKTRFTKRFENKEVSLLIAMDPEIGVGYKSLAQDKEEDPLVQEIKIAKDQEQKAVPGISYSLLHQFILNQLIQQKVVQLQDYKSSAPIQNLPIANTISIMLQQSDEYLVIEQIGGCTANSLLGRFTMANDAVTTLGRKFAATEHDANPAVVFFDIAYQIEKNADNINRRKSVYEYELPILSWTETDTSLDMDDILVSIRGNEIVLRSANLGKRVVPKLGSAYNYNRSDLALYRFLSDLQHQNLHSHLGINILQAFPGLTHYQRIQYKNIVLSPEKWQVPAAVCKENNEQAGLSVLTQWLTAINLTRPFKSGFADQLLVFDPSLLEDLRAFLLFCRNKKDLYIEEAFIPSAPLVKDEYGNPYLAEFIINLEHTNQIYRPYSPVRDGISPVPIKDVFTPGEEWMYFEIYCHSTRGTSILMDIYDSFLPDFKKRIKRWFFIRYTDPSYHIRLRLQLKHPADASMILTGLSRLLERYITTGIIADLQLKTYRQETARYGAGRIHLAERSFMYSSDFVMELISKTASINDLYYLSIKMMEAILNVAQYTIEQQLLFVEDIANRFAAEMNVTTDGFKKLNQGFKNFDLNTSPLLLNKAQVKKLRRTEQSFLEVLQACTLPERNKMLADLFHMHVNRLFSDDQRIHELIIYHYLTRILKTKIGRLKKESANII
jgi:thiopeptide-type bacteriocin biosynthesis protein